MDISEVRKLPELAGLDDEQIVDALHQAYYPDMDRSAVASVLGIKPAAPAAQPRSKLAAVNDTVIEFANAAAGGVKAVGDFISPGNKVSKAIGGFIEEGEASQSDETKAGKAKFRQEVEAADSVGGELAAVGRRVVDAPLQTAAQAAGSFVVPGAAVKGAQIVAKAAGAGAKGAQVAGRGAGVAAGAAMAGGDAAGNAYELVMATPIDVLMQNPEARALAAKGLTEDQIKEELATTAARGASVLPAIVGGAAGAFGAERILAGGAAKAGIKGSLKVGAAEAIQEGIEEGVTSFEGKRAAAGYNPTIDPTKGVAADAGMGVVTGGITGAGVNLLAGKATVADIAAAPDVESAIAAAQAAVIQPTTAQEAARKAKQAAAAAKMTDPQAPLPEGTAAARPGDTASLLLGAMPQDPVQVALQARRDEEATAQNLDNWMKRAEPMPLDQAQDMKAAAAEGGQDFEVVPHSSGQGYTVVPSRWVAPSMRNQTPQAQEAGLLPLDQTPTGTLRATATGAVKPETRADRISTQQSVADQQAEADRKAALGLTPDIEAVQAGVKREPLPTMQQDDIGKKAGGPFQTAKLAEIAAKKRPGAQVVQVQGGYVARLPKPQRMTIEGEPNALEPTDAGRANVAPATVPNEGSAASAATPAGGLLGNAENLPTAALGAVAGPDGAGADVGNGAAASGGGQAAPGLDGDVDAKADTPAPAAPAPVPAKDSTPAEGDAAADGAAGENVTPEQPDGALNEQDPSPGTNPTPEAASPEASTAEGSDATDRAEAPTQAGAGAVEADGAADPREAYIREAEQAYLNKRGGKTRPGEDGNVAMFKRSESTNERNEQNAQSRAKQVGVQQFMDRITENWTNAPEVIVLRDMDDSLVPEKVRSYNDAQKSQGGLGGVEGFYYAGKVYINAAEMSSPERALTVLAHEALGHGGLRMMFGDRLEAIKKQVVLTRRKDVIAKANAYGLDANKQADLMYAAEEVLAELAQSTPQLGLVKRAVAAIRNFLREIGVDLEMTDADLIQAFILPARNYVVNGGPKAKGARGEVSFMRGADRTIEVDGVRRPIEDSKGRLVGRDFKEQQAFWRWAGDTAVTDEQGRPLVVYHGSISGDIESFRLDGDGAVYFTGSSDLASAYSYGRFLSTRPGGGAVYPVHLALSNPLVIDANGKRNDNIPVPWAEWKPKVFGNLPKGAVSVRDAVLRAKEMGHDGLIVRNVVDTPHGDGKLKSDVYVAFASEQAKSATGNNGDFDPANPDIAFSRGEAGDVLGNTLKQLAVTDIKKRTANSLTDYRGLGLQLLGRRQLVDLYADELPQMVRYNELAQQMDAEKNDAGAGADAIATDWGKLPDDRQLAELMHDATLAQIDPAKGFVDGDDKAEWVRLRARWNRLTPEAKAIYEKARDTYEEHYAQVREAIRDRIERSTLSKPAKARLLERMDGEFFSSIKGVYFPLARFGQYVIVVKNAKGETVNVSRAETLNEAEAQRRELLKAFPGTQGNSVGKVIKSAEFNAGRDGVGRGFMSELYDLLESKGMDAELQDSINQLYLSSMPDLSWAKHGIHRKGTPGFSQDARRAFAQNTFHGARYLAKLRHGDKLQAEIDDMQKYVDSRAGDEGYDSIQAQQVVDEMVKRHESMMNPKSNPLSTALTSFGFIFHLGLSPASAMVNLSQTALVAYPIMAAKWGYTKSAAALLGASKQAASNKNDIGTVLTGDEKRAYDLAVKAGTIDVTMAHDLAGIAQGEDSKVAWKMRPVMRAASFLFHHAERFNRQVTFVAAFRLARDTGAGFDAAFEQATQATYDGHFDYAAGNRPRAMQGNVAKVILLFKQYAQNMVYTLSRQAFLSMKGQTPEERSESRKAFAGLLTTHASAAGLLGLPMVGTLLAAASWLGSTDDEPWDAEVALRNMMADTFGAKPAEVLARGFSRLTPWDVSGRVGLDKLIFPDVQEGLEGGRLAEATMAAALGPVAGIGINVLKGVQDMSRGHYLRGLEAMLPTALRSPLKSLRYGTEGAQDRTGIPIVDEVSVAGIAGQAMGFSPSEVRNATEGKSAIYQADRRVEERRRSLLQQYSSAMLVNDREAVQEAREDIFAFNKAQPDRRIKPENMLNSVKNRRKRQAESEQGLYLPKSRRKAMEAGRFAASDT